MAKVRISTTVDETILKTAREVHGGGTDAALIDAALNAYLAQHRRAEVDAAYAAAYDAHPIDEPDEWGSLAQWHATVASAKASARKPAQ
ncbi:MAG: antitoxin MazE5 [Dermatophilus congolensis]|nr:antitoxin MazE5 [Dermatophilus congolensis]